MEPEVKTENTEQVQEREYTPIELEAIDQGWIPKEEFDGDPDKFIDAPEFVRRGELFRKIESQSRELKQVRQAIEALRVHNTKVEEAAYQRALKALNEQRKQAFLDGEHEKAFALEEQIENVKAEKAQITQSQVQPVVDNEYTQQFQEWVARNSWYESDELMRGAADTLGVKLHNEGLSPAEVLKRVEATIRKRFAIDNRKPAAERDNAVEASSRSGGKPSEKFSMSDDERQIMKSIVATGVMTEDEYIKQLKATR